MKKLCIAAAILLVAGIALCIFAAALDGFRAEGLLNQQYSEKTIEIREDFSHIQIDTDTTDVVFSVSEDGSCRILCRETAQQFHTAEVKEGVLSLKQQDARKWYHHIGFHLGTPSVEIYLPKTVYENLAVNGSTGNVTVPKELSFTEAKIVVSTGNIDMQAQVENGFTAELDTGKILVSGTNCETMDVKTSTGEIRVLDVNCKNLTAKSSTGRHLLENVQAVENIQLTSSTGNIHFTRGSCQNLTTESTTGRQTIEYVVASGDVFMESGTGDITLSAFDGETIAITTDTGDVTGTILSEKIFFTETDTGRVEVPHCMSGGNCQITTDTGDIIIQIAQ